MKKEIGKAMEDRFRKLAELGLGDGSIFGPDDCCWIVFRLPSLSVYVRRFGANFDTVEAW